MTTHHHNHRAITRDRIGAHRAREARVITTALALVCGAGLAAAVVPGVETTVNVALLALAGLVVLALGVRYLARCMRERREDRADALTAARWQAMHAPHLLHDHDRALTATTGRGMA
jgi:Flp pilus assembly protein TadB